MDSFSHLSNQQIYRKLGERFVKARISEGLEQQELANKAGVSIGTVQNLEQGKASVGFIKVIAILRALNKLNELDKFMPAPPVHSRALKTTKNEVRVRVRKASLTRKPASKEVMGFVWGKDKK